MAGGLKPAVPLAMAVALAACGGDGSGRQIISETGGETVVLDNGVCILISTTGDEDGITRVSPARCRL